MKIVITGATGFLGAHLVRHYAKLGHEVLAMGRQQHAPKALSQLATYISADLTGDIPKLSADCCIHTAAKADDFGSYKEFKAINVIGTQKVFAAIDCPLFLQISSASIYPLLDQAIDETAVDPAKFLSSYGKSKWEAEQFLAQQFSTTKSICVLRPRAIYGTHDRVLLPRILNLVKRQQLLLPGDFRIQVSMTHIANLIHAIDLFISHHSPGFTVYNVADQDTYNLRKVVEQITFGCYDQYFPAKEIPLWLVHTYLKGCELVGIRPSVSSQAIDYVSNSTVLNTQKIELGLGYQAESNFHQVLPEIVKWVKSVGIKKVLQASPDLCWTSLDFAEKSTEQNGD